MNALDVRRRDSSSGDARPPRRDPRPTVDAPVPQFPGYEIRGELGRGGMGVVYRAFDERRGEVVALKTLHWGDPAALYRFKQEFRGFADLSHDNLVSLHELVSDGRAWFFTMELVDGVTFLDWVREDKERLRPAMAQLMSGLAALHAKDRVHRDVKPSNVLVTKEGRVVLLDFGLAAELAADGLHRSTKSHVLGTVAYMSPEQAMGRPVSAASDVYSAGVMLFEALAGRLPFEGDPIQILIDKRTREAPRVASLAADVAGDLDVLCCELLARDPNARPGVEDVANRLLRAVGAAPGVATDVELEATAPSRSLVGRDRHLAALAGALRVLESGKPVVALVHGASGMGKSALVQSFVDEIAASRRAVVFSGRCYERESVPYKAFDSAMDALAGHLARMSKQDAAAILPRDVGALTRVFPVLRRAEAVTGAPQGAADIADPAELRRRAFGALRELFARIADRRPLVLWADDLQWGDADSADLLAALLRPPDPPAMLVIGSYRREDAATSAFLSSALPATAGLAERIEIAVDPLDAGDAAQLAARLTGGDAERALVVARESRGNPFFVHELAEFGAAAADEALTLDAVVADRVSRLPADARRLLETVAVSGGPVPLRSAIRAADVDASARAAVAALRAGRLIRVRGAAPDDQLDTYHDRIRETVVARLTADALRERHRRLGLALELSNATDPEALAVHFDGAGDPARAAHHYQRAAATAVDALAFDHAARLYRLAIATLAPADPSRRPLQVRLADALRDGRRGAEAAQAYLDAAEGAELTQAVDLRRRAAEEFMTSGRIDQGLTMVREVLSAIGIRLQQGRVRTTISIALRIAYLRVRGLGYRARDPATIDPAVLFRIDMARALMQTLSHTIPLVGFDIQMRYVILALRAGEPGRATVASLYHRGWMCMAGIVTDERRADAVMRDAMTLQAQSDDPALRAWCDFVCGTYSYHAGRWRRALDHSLASRRALLERCGGRTSELNTSSCYVVWSQSYLGELAAMEALVTELLADADARGDLFLATVLRTRLRYLVDLAHDDPDAAVRGARAGLAAWARPGFDLQHFWALFAECESALYRRDATAASGLVRANWKRIRDEGLLRFPIIANEAHGLAARAALLAASECDDPAQRRRRLRRADESARRLAASHWAYAREWSRLTLAGVAAVAGDVRAAVDGYARSAVELDASGAFLHAAAALRRQGELTGGDEGRALVAESERRMTSRGIVNPARWTDMYAPGPRR